jgi:hypothetical protein
MYSIQLSFPRRPTANNLKTSDSEFNLPMSYLI